MKPLSIMTGMDYLNMVLLMMLQNCISNPEAVSVLMAPGVEQIVIMPVFTGMSKMLMIMLMLKFSNQQQMA